MTPRPPAAGMWLRLIDLGTVEASTGVAVGDHTSSTVSQGGSGGAGGDSHVVIHIAQQLDNPPETMAEYLKSLWKNQLMGQRDQYLYREQREAEERHYRRWLQRWLIGLTAVVSVLLIIMVVWIVQWTERFGWLW